MAPQPSDSEVGTPSAAASLRAMPTVLLVGCGRMGGALARRWLEYGLPPEKLAIVEPDKDAVTHRMAPMTGFAVYTDLKTFPRALKPRILVLAVKPQIIPGVLDEIRCVLAPETVLLSIAAGIRICYLQENLHPTTPIIRAMPNTPAAIGRGMTVAIANGQASDTDRRHISALLTAAGQLVWIEDETLIDAVTAVSGSGPAFLFLFMEAMADAAISVGLPDALANAISRETVLGAVMLTDRRSDSASTLREEVTSPGGTTEAALEILMAEDGMTTLMRRAVTAAKDRAIILSGNGQEAMSKRR